MLPRFVFIAVVALCCVPSAATADLVTLIDPGGGDDRISSITGVTISGTTNDGVFDLTYHHGISYDDLESALGKSPITWTTPTEAFIVVNAIEAAINSFGDVTGTRTLTHLVPHDDTAISSGFPGVLSAFGLHSISENYSDAFSLEGASTLNRQDLAPPTTTAWVTASASSAVPEASSFLYLGLVGIGMIAMAAVKRHRAAIKVE